MNSSSRAAVAALAACAALLLPAAAPAQDAAGRVLVAIGDVVIERGAERIVARPGTEVRTGDQLQLGAQSNAQVRLSDESIIALRADTTFKLTEYAFVAQDESKQRAFFELLKGGVRTVTGAIGRVRRDDYRVTTPTATIGIRGTHYSLVQCDANCRNRDGTTVPAGTYGGVTDGRIAVANRSGESVFGADQYFHVASPTASPQPLIAPPGFLRDTLEGRARSQQQKPAPGEAPKAQAAQAQQQSGGEKAGTVAQTGLGATTGDSSVTGSVSSAAPVVLPPTTLLNTFVTNGTITPGGVASTVQTGFTGTIFYRLAGPFSIPVTCTNPPCSTVTNGQIILGVNFALQRAFLKVDLTVGNGYVNVGTPFNTDGIPVTVSNGAINFGATINRADYPTQQGAFRCFDCGTTNLTPGFIDSVSVNGTISGGTATLTLGAVDSGGTATLGTVNLTQVSTPNTDAAAGVFRRQSGGADARSAAYWDVTVDASRRLTAFGPNVGAIRANVGTATNTIVGSAPTAGNLVWGYWQGASSQVTDFDYQTFNTSTTVPWITGTATNTLSPTLGSATYSLIGGTVNGGNGTLNSGSLSADFVNRTMSISLNATSNSSGNTFQMSGNSGISSTSGRFSAGFSSVTCSGPCSGGTPTGSFGGFFAGTQADGAGVAFTAGFGAGTGVSGAAAFKR